MSTKRTASTPSAHARRDIARDITDKILNALARGVLPWRKPWSAAPTGLALPRRACGTPYRGVNVILLWNAACDRGFASPCWLTFRQAQALGAHVRKGERSEAVVYWGKAQRARNGDAALEDDHARAYRFLKSYAVFNADQIEALPDAYHEAGHAPDRAWRTVREIAAHEAWFARLGIARILSRDIACYIPARDVIAMPPVALFRTRELYAATLNHEAVHATGAKHRLDRDFSARFTNKARAMEELVAEIGAAMLGAHHGLAPSHIEDHAAYISHWMTLLRHDDRAFLHACAKAQAAVDWLLDAAPLGPCGVEGAS